MDESKPSSWDMVFDRKSETIQKYNETVRLQESNIDNSQSESMSSEANIIDRNYPKIEIIGKMNSTERTERCQKQDDLMLNGKGMEFDVKRSKLEYHFKKSQHQDAEALNYESTNRHCDSSDEKHLEPENSDTKVLPHHTEIIHHRPEEASDKEVSSLGTSPPFHGYEMVMSKIQATLSPIRAVFGCNNDISHNEIQSDCSKIDYFFKSKQLFV